MSANDSNRQKSQPSHGIRIALPTDIVGSYPQVGGQAKRTVNIEYLYLDLTQCTRCQSAKDK